MSRTQIYLGPEELELLERAAHATGASRSELIRRAVKRTYGGSPQADKLRALEASGGTWTARDFTGSDYVEAVRGDLGERLRRFDQE